MSAIKYNVGDEVCLVKNRQGIIQFKGQIEGKKGSYYGVEVTLGKGKHSGMYKHVKYFECEEGQGIFVEDKHVYYKIENSMSDKEKEEEEEDNVYKIQIPGSATPVTPTTSTTPITPETLTPNKRSKKSRKKKQKKQRKKKKKKKKPKSPYITQLEYVESDEELDLLETDAAKSLLSLSKTELIKKCKAKGIVCLGKKEELVNKLLTTKQVRNYSFKRVNSFTLNERDYKHEYLTLYECNYYFICGYIKQNMVEIENNTIYNIKIMLLQYINSVLPKFDLCPKVYRKEIKKNGSLIKQNKSKKQYLVGCSKGFEANSGVYRFSIRINKLNKYRHKNDKEKDEIGLISDTKYIGMRDVDDDIALWNVDCDSYYISLNQVYGTHKISSGGFNQDKIGLLSNDSMPIKREDIITIVLNTNRSRLYFEKNGKRYCESFDIISNCVYYPCVSCGSKHNEYEIVFF